MVMMGPWPDRKKPIRPSMDQWKTVMQGAPGLDPVKHQHVVSRALIRFFNTPPGSNQMGVGTVNLKYCKFRPRAPKGCGAMEFWTTRFTGEAEDLWGRTENNLPATINAVAARSIFQSATSVAALKAIVALHHARSFNTRRLAQKVSDLAVQEGFESCIQTPAKRQYLVDHATRQLGPGAQTDSDIKAAFIDMTKKSNKFDPADSFRKNAAEFFVELTDYLDRCQVQILVAPKDRYFVLGDTPVVAEGDPPVGASKVHYIPPIQDAEVVHFPVHPKFCVRFPAAYPGYVELGRSAVDRINRRQVEQAYREVYFFTDPRTRQFVMNEARGHRAWPNIGDLTIR